MFYIFYIFTIPYIYIVTSKSKGMVGWMRCQHKMGTFISMGMTTSFSKDQIQLQSITWDNENSRIDLGKL